MKSGPCKFRTWQKVQATINHRQRNTWRVSLQTTFMLAYHPQKNNGFQNQLSEIASFPAAQLLQLQCTSCRQNAAVRTRLTLAVDWRRRRITITTGLLLWWDVTSRARMKDQIMHQQLRSCTHFATKHQIFDIIFNTGSMRGRKTWNCGRTNLFI